MPVAPNDESYIFGAVFVLANRIQSVGARVTGELTVRQWFILLVLRDLPQGCSIADIAADAGTSRQNVKQLLGPLAKKGYLELCKNEQDRRATAVHLTQKGRQYLGDISVDGGVFIEKMFRGVPSRQIADARRLMQGLLQNLEEMSR